MRNAISRTLGFVVRPSIYAMAVFTLTLVWWRYFHGQYRGLSAYTVTLIVSTLMIRIVDLEFTSRALRRSLSALQQSTAKTNEG